MYAPAARKIQGGEVKLREHTEYGEREGKRDKEKKRDDKERERKREHLFTLSENKGVRDSCMLSHINTEEKRERRGLHSSVHETK